MFARFTAALCVVASVFFIACQTPESVINQEATALVNDAIENRANLENMTGTGEMKIVDQGSDFSLSVKVDMVAQNPGNLRIRATKLADAIVAFDMLMQGSNAAFFIPTRNMLYTGNIDNLKSGGVNFSPHAVISRILRSDRGLLDRRWKMIGQSKEGLFSNNLVLEQIHSKGQQYVRIHIDGQRKVLLKVLHFNSQDKLYFEEEYNGYQEIKSGQTTLSGKSVGTGSFFPTRFLLRWPDKERYVKVTLRRYEYNQPQNVIEQFWTIDDLDMDSVVKKSLSQIQVESDAKAN